MLAATVYFWIDPPVRIGFLLSYILLVYLGVVFVIDLEHRLIMHPVSITGAILGLGIGSYANGLVPTLLGGAFGFGSMLLLYYLGEVFTRYMSKRRGEPVDEVALGFGDVNLCGVTGLLLGWPVILAGILFTIFAGGIGSIAGHCLHAHSKTLQCLYPHSLRAFSDLFRFILFVPINFFHSNHGFSIYNAHGHKLRLPALEKSAICDRAGYRRGKWGVLGE
jgi:hypothetical protein